MAYAALVAVTDEGASTGELPSLLALCGFGSRIVTRLPEAMRILQEHPPTVIILQASDSSGRSLCRTLRALTTEPIVAICPARSEELVVELLEAGADCVLGEPLSRRELSARLHALLRRRREVPAGDRRRGVYRCGNLSIDVASHVVRIGERTLSLTATEFRLLLALLRQAGTVVPHAVLIAEVWGNAHGDRPANLRLYIRHLRQKLAGDQHQPSVLVRNHWGIGYRLAAIPARSKEQGLAYG